MADDITVPLDLEETIRSLIVQVVSLQAQAKIQAAYISSLSQLVNSNLQGQYEKLFDELYHQTFVEQLDLMYPDLSEGWRKWILSHLGISPDSPQ